jgi:hypothetical protein
MAKSSKQDALPGMADRKLKDLHDCALEYAEARDERQAIGAREVELKGKLLDLMHKHKKEEYTYEDVHINIVHEEETVKVKIKKAKDGEEDPDEPEE